MTAYEVTGEVIQVIKITFRRGKGIAPDDPVRIVTVYLALDGEFLAEDDPCSPSALAEAVRHG